jgi:hypothetical protein
VLYATLILVHYPSIPPFEVCYCPDKITGLLLTLLGHSITTFDPKHQSSMLAYAADSGHMSELALSVPEFMLYHYITPRKLLAADQRVHHEKVAVDLYLYTDPQHQHNPTVQRTR